MSCHMSEPRLFDAHTHPRPLPGPGGYAPSGADLSLCSGSSPDDWEKIASLSSEDGRVLPCFGLHPWFAEKAGPGWLKKLEGFLRGRPSCVGEIGLDKAADTGPGPQMEVFRAQLRLARGLARPAVLHCVGAWGPLAAALREEAPPVFMVHAYGGSPETAEELAGLGCYFSFGADLLKAGRIKARRAIRAVPADRLLFETEGLSGGGLADVVSAAAGILGERPEVLAGLSWNNARRFLGGLFPDVFR